MSKKIEFLKSQLQKRILVLDGAMGTMLQAQGLKESDFNAGPFANHPKPLMGDNDVLCITRPDAVKTVHNAYLEAGADIIETNTFNSNAVSQADYGLEDRVYDLAFAGAKIAREAADAMTARTPGKPRFVAGSMGPTGRTASMSPSVDDPAARNITFDELAATYQVQAEALIDGGADILLVETIFDTLNAKAAVYAIGNAMRTRNTRIPVMLSATLSDASGRMLAGQCAEAFLISMLHTEELLTVGFNCALGAEEMHPHLAELAAKAPCLVSAHPNAGLPDIFGKYEQTPDQMAAIIREFAEEGLLNIVGGCCGTTPAHIGAIAKAVEGIAPRVPPQIKPYLRLSGLDPFIASPDKNFINVGERTNVAGSRKFLNLIKADDMHAAMSVALHQIENGASIIDINMDDAMLDSLAAMKRFLLYLASEPEISRVPIMVDSSDWEVVKTALRCIQGKSIVNSISLKEGEEKFLEKAREIRRLGAAILVMAFDEKGQADTLERRIKVCERSYRLLTEQAGVAPEDIVFDPNIFAVATGMKEHDNYAVDFIEAVRYIHTHMPLCGISGGVSNVSFSFRGNDTVRGAIHTVFLKHAIDAGMTMGIVNAAQLGVYEDLDPELRKAAEAVVLNTDPGAAEKMIEIASGLKTETKKTAAADQWRSEPLAERIARSLVKGDDSYVAEDMAEALKTYPSPMKIVEGPLMDGMGRVGELFSSGRMFLPQVVKSARVMKRSVAELMPAIEALKESGEGGKSCKVVIATVKGDVHDIGKNIVSVVLQCNNCTVVDLGVMVPAKTIVDAAVENNADVIGLSGLITPSLEEMVNVVGELERRGLKIPVLLGGAATSKLHTALKIQPFYSAPVIYTHDASASVPVVANLMNPEKRGPFLERLKEEYAALTDAVGQKQDAYLPYPEARAKAEKHGHAARAPEQPGTHRFTLTLPALEEYIDWDGFVRSWDMPLRGCCSADLVREAKDLLAAVPLRAECICGVFPARADTDAIYIQDAEFPTLRQQNTKSKYLALADFVAEKDDYVGMFAVSVFGAEERAAAFKAEGDDYSAILLKTVANRVAEAAAEVIHLRMRREIWGFETGKPLPVAELLRNRYTGIRPAPGYPTLPDHSLKREIFGLLNAEKELGTALTDSFMMVPQASVCALVLANAESSYFAVGKVQEDQLLPYAERRGFEPDVMRKLIS